MSIQKKKTNVEHRVDPYHEDALAANNVEPPRATIPSSARKRTTPTPPTTSSPATPTPSTPPKPPKPPAPLTKPTPAVVPPPKSSLTTARYRKLNLSGLVTDVVLFGQDDLEGVAQAHKLTLDELDYLLNHDEPFRSRYVALRKAIEADPQKMLTLRASAVIEAHITTMSRLIADEDIEAKDRVKAFETIARLAGLGEDKNKQKMAGVIVNFSMGLSSLPTPNVKPVNTIIVGDSE